MHNIAVKIKQYSHNILLDLTTDNNLTPKTNKEFKAILLLIQIQELTQCA